MRQRHAAVGPDGEVDGGHGRKRGAIARHLHLDDPRERFVGAVRHRVGARIAESPVRGAGKDGGRRRKAHPRRQLSPGAGERIRVRWDSAFSLRQGVAVVVGSDGKATDIDRADKSEDIDRSDSQAQSIRHASLRPEPGVGFGDAVGAEDGLARFLDWGGASQDSVV